MTGRERVRAAAFSLVFLVGGYVLTLVFFLLAAPLLASAQLSWVELTGMQSAGMLAAYGVLTWLIGGKVLQLSRADFERPLARRSPRGRGLGSGVLIGAGLAALAMGAAVVLGQAEWREDGGTALQWLGALGLTSLVLVPAAAAEELAFRGVPLIALSRAFGRTPALVVLAILFGSAHFANPEAGSLALANIALAGVFLGLMFFTPGGLWTSTGAHLGWNLTLAGLAAPVSGIPLAMPWLDYSTGGPAWLTGGSFGPEGGVLASLCLVGGSVLAIRRGRKGDGREAA
ncbi:MAG: lysostaphin resistance A-like protein [Gemmatimonadales bacterium]